MLGNFDKFWAILTFFQYFWQFWGDLRIILGFGSECKKVSYRYNATVAGREMFPYWYFWVLSAWGLSMITLHKLHFLYHRMLPSTSPWSDPISFNHLDVLLVRYHLKLWFKKFGLVLFSITRRSTSESRYLLP